MNQPLLETLKQARDAMAQVDSRPNGLWNIKTELANLTTAIEQLEKAEPAGADPLPDDVAAMVERLRDNTLVIQHPERNTIADMLERLARELVAKQDEINFMSECVKTACEDRKYFEERAAERNKLANDLKAAQKELAAVKAENKKLRYATTEVISSNVVGERDNLREELADAKHDVAELRRVNKLIGEELAAVKAERNDKDDACDEAWFKIDELRTELAATQLQLKEALEALETCTTSERYLDPCMQWQGGVQSFNSAKVEAALSRPADTTALNLYVAETTETAWAQARRLALELECLLLSSEDTTAVSKWWDSAHEALDEYRRVSADELEGK